MSPSRSRRDVLRLGGSAAALALAGALPGCGSLERSPRAGSVVFDNRLSVPQVVTLRATSGPLDTDDVMRYAGMDAGLDAGERKVVADVFTDPGSYEVEGWPISQDPKTTRWGAETAEVDIRPGDDYAEYLHVVLLLLRTDAGLLNLTAGAAGEGVARWGDRSNGGRPPRRLPTFMRVVFPP